jgi:hypothetical protein
MVNWSLLGLNVVLFVFLGLTALHNSLPETDIRIDRGPLKFSSSKDSHGNVFLSLVQADEPLDVTAFTLAPAEPSLHKQELPLKCIVVGFGVGNNFTSSIAYSRLPNNHLEIRSISVRRQDSSGLEEWIDYKGDGTYDVHSHQDPEGKSSSSILLKGQWQEVIDVSGEFDKKIIGGRRVRYDWILGQWLVDTKVDGEDRKKVETEVK